MRRKAVFASFTILLAGSLASNAYLLFRLERKPERVVVRTPTPLTNEVFWWKPDTAKVLADSTVTDPDLLKFVSRGFLKMSSAEQRASLERWCVLHMGETYSSLPPAQQLSFLTDLQKDAVELLAEKEFES